MTLELFHFKGNDGKDYTLPKKVKSGQLRRASLGSRDNLQMMFMLTTEVASADALGALDDLDNDQFTQVTSDWLQGMNPGNS